MYKYSLALILIILTGACEKQPVSHETVFEAMLGFETNQIGSNVPILESYTNRQGFPDSFLIDIPKPVINKGYIYIADSYNKKVNVFLLKNQRKISEPLEVVLSIPNQGIGYNFARPYEVLVDSNKDLYILASINDFESYEVQNYSNQTAEIQNYDKFQQNIRQIPAENFYLYKFSAQGEFIHRLGLQGIDSQALKYPNYLNSDNFGNIYMGFNDNINDKIRLSIYRYSSNGNKNFEFTDKDINIQTNINGIYYQGNIISINNYKNKEQLALVIEYQPTTDTNNNDIPATIENTWSSLDSYNIADEVITQDMTNSFGITETILGIDRQDRVFLQSFDEKQNALKIRIIDMTKQQIYYTPIQSSYYTLFDYFIDHTGNLYNYLLDRNRKLIVLRWHINTQEDSTETPKIIQPDNIEITVQQETE